MYREMYTTLFNAITKALKDLGDGDSVTAVWRLTEAQRETENMFMDWNWEDGGEPEE